MMNEGSRAITHYIVPAGKNKGVGLEGLEFFCFSRQHSMPL